MSNPERIGGLMAAQQRAAALGTVHSDMIAARLGITGTDLKCLFLLLQEARTPRELATELRLTPSAITSVIDRMEKAGFARREPAPADRRRVLVTAIPERAQEATALYGQLYTRMLDLLSTYDAAQLATLQDFAERSVRILEEETQRLGER